jgi:large subunit ribosomal protein L17
MRHGVKGRKLGRTSAHREALFRNQLQSLMDKERIITTLPKAKELRPLAERVITRGKQGSLHARRWVLRWVLKRDLVKKIFDDIAPRFKERPGGYLRIVKLGPRLGDGAEMAVIEMVDRVETAKEKGTAKGAGGGARKAHRARSKGSKAGGPSGRGAAAQEEGAPAGEGAEDEAAAKSATKAEGKSVKAGKAGKPGRSGKPAKSEKKGKGEKGGEGRKPTTPKPGGKKPPTRQKTG